MILYTNLFLDKIVELAKLQLWLFDISSELMLEPVHVRKSSSKLSSSLT